MSWTVPSGCYYGFDRYKTSVLPQAYLYYSAGQSVPDEYAPTAPPSSAKGHYILMDFDNGIIYAIYSIGMTININNSNSTFTFVSTGNGFSSNNLYVIGSNDALAFSQITTTGDNFVFGQTVRSPFVNQYVNFQCTHTFQGRTDITTAPTIPNGVANMEYCFEGCTSLTTPSVLPNSVTRLFRCFYGCESLTTAPTIPSSVSNMYQCFYGCESLAGAVTIDSNAQGTDMFTGTLNEIVLLGSSSTLENIASAYNNVYVWSLFDTITAVRNEMTQTTVDVSVNVSRYNTGNLTSLTLYKDSVQQTVTWNDPTLAITSTPTTFTTSLTNVAENDTIMVSVIATDSYGSATEVSVNVPIAFYTIDVRAGGKEIAFGKMADENLTNYPNGLFKCAMDIVADRDVDVAGDLTVGATDVGSTLTTLTTWKNNVADYVVEQGTSGKWIYRKWNSKRYEAWYDSGQTTITTSTSSGNGWYRNSSEYTINMPTGLGFSTVRYANISVNTSYANLITSLTQGNTTQLGYYVSHLGSLSSVTAYVSAYVEGGWS